MQRFIKAVAAGNFGDYLRIQPPRAAILIIPQLAAVQGLRAGQGIAMAAAKAGRLSKLDGGNRLIHRPARRNLYDKEIERDNGPQRGDYQQQAF